MFINDEWEILTHSSVRDNVKSIMRTVDKYFPDQFIQSA